MSAMNMLGKHIGGSIKVYQDKQDAEDAYEQYTDTAEQE